VQTFNQTLRTFSGNAGGANIFFHIHGKGNKNAEGLFYGQAVKYSQGVSAKGVCAENIVAITGVRTRVCVYHSHLAPARHLISIHHQSASYFLS
jgi:cold shock CspA family protein